VHLHTRTITASKCISRLARLRPASAHDHGLQVHLQTRSIPASKRITAFMRSPSPGESQTPSIKYIFKEQWQLYGDTGVREVDRVTGSIYLADPGVDRHHLISISSYHTMKIHTLSFPTFGLTHSVREYVDSRNCVDSHGRVVSYLLTSLRSPSSMEMECEERFSQPHALHCNPNASVYPMNPFRRMVTVGHNCRPFV